MTFERAHNNGSRLYYVGKRSSETRFMVLGVHNVKEHVSRPFKMLEFTYYPRRTKYRAGVRFVIPKRNRRGPFFIFKYARGNWLEVLVGWQHGWKYQERRWRR